MSGRLLLQHLEPPPEWSRPFGRQRISPVGPSILRISAASHPPALHGHVPVILRWWQAHVCHPKAMPRWSPGDGRKRSIGGSGRPFHGRKRPGVEVRPAPSNDQLRAEDWASASSKSRSQPAWQGHQPPRRRYCRQGASLRFPLLST